MNIQKDKEWESLVNRLEREKGGIKVGSGCGLVGRDPRFKSSPWQTFIEHLFTVNCVEKKKIKKNEAGNGPFLKVG